MGHFHIPPGRAATDGVGHGIEDRANVIWLLTDQHRHHALGHAGDPNLHTPVLDQLAQHGRCCGRGAVSGMPLCCPFRGSLLTSRWPHHCVPLHEAPMPDDLPTVADAFNAHGYHTAWFGKWHVDGGRERDGRNAFWIVPPARRGRFQEWVGYENNNDQWDCWVHGGEGKDAFHERLEGYETDVLTDRFVAYLERRAQAGTPFFAALSVQPPHWPCQCPETFRRLRGDEIRLRANVPPGSAAEARARAAGPGYYGMIENWDANVGRIVTALRRLGLYERTHLMIFADHGEMLGSHGQFGKVLPHEESIRIPFILAGGSRYANLREGTTDALVNHVDIAPTSLGLAGLPVPDWMTGYDWSHLRRGGEPRAPEPDATLVQALGPREGSPAYRAIVTRDGWKYAVTEDGPWLLFNLEDDPFELADLSRIPRHRERRAELHGRLRDLVTGKGDDFPALARPPG
jgi:arylsulfatase A-like enzyme